MRLQKVRNVIKMPLKLLFLCGKITNNAHWLGAPPPGPSLGHTQVASVCLAQGLNYRIFEKKNFFSPLFSKIQVVRLAAFTAADRVFKRLQQGRN